MHVRYPPRPSYYYTRGLINDRYARIPATKAADIVKGTPVAFHALADAHRHDSFTDTSADTFANTFTNTFTKTKSEHLCRDRDVDTAALNDARVPHDWGLRKGVRQDVVALRELMCLTISSNRLVYHITC